jgi:hypothetical protein
VDEGVFRNPDTLPCVTRIPWSRCPHRRAVRLQLHRPYCTIAAREYAVDPTGSPYGSSVIIALRSASALLAIADTTYEYMVTIDVRLRDGMPGSPPAQVFPATRFNCGNEAINIGMVLGRHPLPVRALTDHADSARVDCNALPGTACRYGRAEADRAHARRRCEELGRVRRRLWNPGACSASHAAVRFPRVLMRLQKRMGALRDLARAVYTAHAAPAGAQVFRPSAEQIEAVLAAPTSSDNDGPAYFMADTTTVCGPLPGDELEWSSTYVDMHVMGSWPSSGSDGSDR